MWELERKREKDWEGFTKRFDNFLSELSKGLTSEGDMWDWKDWTLPPSTNTRPNDRHPSCPHGSLKIILTSMEWRHVEHTHTQSMPNGTFEIQRGLISPPSLSAWPKADREPSKYYMRHELSPRSCMWLKRVKSWSKVTQWQSLVFSWVRRGCCAKIRAFLSPIDLMKSEPKSL